MLRAYMGAMASMEPDFAHIAALAVIMEGTNPAFSHEEAQKNGWTMAEAYSFNRQCGDFFDVKRGRGSLARALMLDELRSPREDSALIVHTLRFLSASMEAPPFRSFLPMLERDPFDLCLLEYMLVEHPEVYGDEIFGRMKRSFPEALFSGPSIIPEEALGPEHKPDIWLKYLLKAMAEHHLDDDPFYLRCLKARYQDVRAEAAAALWKRRSILSDQSLALIREAAPLEPDREIRKRLHRFSKGKGGALEKERRYVDIAAPIIKPSRRDVPLMTTYIAGTYYRDLTEISAQLAKGDILRLKREPENEYDSRAVLVCTGEGYVLGYIPKADNALPSQLLDGGETLYGVLLEELPPYGGQPAICILRASGEKREGNVISFPDILI